MGGCTRGAGGPRTLLAIDGGCGMGVQIGGDSAEARGPCAVLWFNWKRRRGCREVQYTGGSVPHRGQYPG